MTTRDLKTLYKISLLLVVVTMSILSGCSKPPADQVVVYLRGMSPGQSRIWRSLTQGFEQQHPGLRVKILNIPYDAYWSKLFTMIASGNPPDVVLVESGFYPAFVRKQAFLDLTDRIKQSTDISLEAYYPRALAWLWIDQRIYGLPTDNAVIIPFFNVDLFDKYGVAHPAEGWTWDDYLETAKRLTRDTDGDGNTDTWGTFLPPWEPYLWSNGGDWVDDPERPTRCTFDQPVNIDSIRWLADCRNVHRVTPLETALTAQEDPFQTQRVAITWNGHWAVPDYRQRLKFRWDVAPLPRGKAGTAGYSFGSCFSIPVQAKRPDLAWELVKFMTGPAGSRLMANQGLITPALREVGEDPEFLRQSPPQHHARFMDAVEHGHIYPKTPVFEEMRSMMNLELEKAFLGEVTAESACRTIAIKGNQLLKLAGSQ